MNKVILLGRLTADPEIRYTQTTNEMIVTICLAVKRQYKDETDFINNITAFKHNAEFISKYFKKGQQVVIVGRIQVDNWQDKDGNKKTTTRIIVDETYFADSKKENKQDVVNDEDLDLPF